MSLNLFEVQEAIVAKIREEFVNYEVHEDALHDDYLIRLDANGKLRSYFVVRFGPARRTAGGGNMGNQRNDEFYSTMDLSVVAREGKIARQVMSIAHDRLEGWAPEHGEKLTGGGGTGYFTILSNDARPTAYIVEMRFRFQFNGQSVGSAIPVPEP